MPYPFADDQQPREMPGKLMAGDDQGDLRPSSSREAGLICVKK
jgi:hypothetical protein